MNNGNYVSMIKINIVSAIVFSLVILMFWGCDTSYSERYPECELEIINSLEDSVTEVFLVLQSVDDWGEMKNTGDVLSGDSISFSVSKDVYKLRITIDDDIVREYENIDLSSFEEYQITIQ